MSLNNQQIRALAERVAASHGLEVVDLELQGGGGKFRTLRIFLERNAAGRAELNQRLKALRAQQDDEPLAAQDNAEQQDDANEPDGSIVLDLVDAGEVAGLTPEEDELSYLRELPQGVPVEQLSGITHGDCERFSKDFGTALDVEDLVPGAEYVLEASSPGLDRKLSKPEEFARFEGQLCKVQTFTPVAGNRHWQGHLGVIKGETGEIVTLIPVTPKTKNALKTGKKKKSGNDAAGTIEIALSNIEKAQLVPEF
jgi:ribosome maturation factor RimP